jgi:hypothetical protein
MLCVAANVISRWCSCARDVHVELAQMLRTAVTTFSSSRRTGDEASGAVMGMKPRPRRCRDWRASDKSRVSSWPAERKLGLVDEEALLLVVLLLLVDRVDVPQVLAEGARRRRVPIAGAVRDALREVTLRARGAPVAAAVENGR